MGGTDNIPLSNCLVWKVNTSFLQLYKDHTTRSSEQWDALFKQAHDMNIKYLIIQWSSYGSIPFYSQENSSSSLLTKVIKAAQKEQIKLIIGTNYDPNYWASLEGKEIQIQEYLKRHYEQQVQAIPKLISNINEVDPQGKTVTGWYLSDEIDDLNWQSESRRMMIKNYLEQMIQLLKKEKPYWPINISTYSTGKTPYNQVAELYKFLFNIKGLDKILFQDSIGTQKLTLRSLKAYLLAIRSQFSGNNQRFGIITELFTEDENQRSFKSAPVDRVIRQLKIAEIFSDAKFTIFSFFPYIVSDKPDTRNSELYDFWQGQIHQCKPPSDIH